jgi:hypothetical protein
VATTNGTYPIPSDCSIPTPSDAIPAATDFTTYALNADNVEAVYLAYLNSVYRGPGTTFTSVTDLCGNPHLGFVFNWTGFWHARLNISLSIYLSNGTSPVGVNGSLDTHEIYLSPSTWAVTTVDPALLYPFEYTADLPTQKIVPIAVNNPMAALLINYTGNVLYGATDLKPNWGVPTYLTLEGAGNYSLVNGTTSTVTSGKPVTDGDAIYINSCRLNNVTQSTCNISATYFDNFSFGLVHAISPPVPVPIGGSSGLNGAFCGSLFSWIPVIGSLITGACNFVLGFLEIILIIVVLAIAIWLVSKVSGSRSSRGGGSTVNVYTGGRRS